MSGNVTPLIDLNDSDVLRLEGVLRRLNANLGERRDLEGFRKEILDRFAAVGFKVNVKVWSTPTEGMFTFDIEIADRIEGQFDPDQMVFEATRDILNLGTGGVIKTDGGLYVPSQGTHVHKH